MAASMQIRSSDAALIGGVLARKSFARFVPWVMPAVEMTDFHHSYYAILNAFAQGRIRKLIVSVPPQHGKSLASSQMLPAFMLGVNPDLKICIASYAFSLATKFNKRVQRVIKDTQYGRIFPETTLKDNSAKPKASDYVQTSEEFEVVGHSGGLRAVGREGGLTGNTVDVMILDDLYKDAMEANSPQIRENTWEFYTSVVKTRLHNDSQELIVFTRWHEDDLIGRIEKNETVVTLTSFDQIDPQADCWYKLNFEAIKESGTTPIDARDEGQALWPSRHSRKLLDDKRRLDRLQFDCMYQGNPTTKEGLLYGDNFGIYSGLPDAIIKRANYTDTADTGTDMLCSVCYAVVKDGDTRRIYITDVVYSAEPMEITEPAVGTMIARNNTRISYIESNNGGRGFARAIARISGNTRVEAFHQSGNKEARILTNATLVVDRILMPEGWQALWPKFHTDITMFKRIFKANKHDDAADTLTGVVEREVAEKKIMTIGFTK